MMWELRSMCSDFQSVSCLAPLASASKTSSFQLWRTLCRHAVRRLLTFQVSACSAGILKELQQSRQARMEEVHLTRSAWLAILGSRGHSLGSGTKKS